MAGEKDLKKLLTQLEPRLNPGAFVFCSLPDISGIDLQEVILIFREAEGTTLILPQETADRLGLPYDGIMAWLSLSVHSALEAVGLTAAFSNALARQNISCNVVAGYYHDHIFVPQNDAGQAMRVLQQLSHT